MAECTLFGLKSEEKKKKRSLAAPVRLIIFIFILSAVVLKRHWVII